MDQKILLLAKELIGIPSVSSNAQEIQRVLEAAKRELSDFQVESFEKDGKPSLFVSNRPGEKTCKIILNAHIDVVPAKENQFIPIEKDGKLYGRGSYDMKSAAAVMILLFTELAKEVHYTLGLQLVTDEETGGFAGTKYQIEQGISADFVIAGENTDLLINNTSKGIVWLKVTTTGKAAHGAYPWLGENAIWKMKKNLDLLEKLYPVPQKDVWETTVNLAKISTTNDAMNKTPDQCEIGLDIRYIPEEKDTILQKLKDSFVPGTEITLLTNEPAHSTDKTNSYITHLKQAIKTVTGKTGELVAKHGGSDVRFYNEIGKDGITFGPTGFGHHADEEWVDVKSLSEYYEILKTFLLSV